MEADIMLRTIDWIAFAVASAWIAIGLSLDYF